MTNRPSIFSGQANFDPSLDLDRFLKTVPARWAVYLFAGADDFPVQLLCVRNLRYSLKRRLGGDETVGVSKRVNYREIVRQVFWRRVDSAFEADWVYLEAARELFPESYRKLVGFRPAWFVHVDPNALFPRYVKTVDLAQESGVLLGPLKDRQSAGGLIQAVEDCFELCRYYNILIEAPRGKACAYKEMGKCPAPCDGTISMEECRAMVRRSAEAMVYPGALVMEQTQRMGQAATALQFELAGRIKAKVEQASRFGQGEFRYVRRLADFAFLSVQPGPRPGTAKLFLITPGEIAEVAGLIGEPAAWSDILRHVLDLAATRRTTAVLPPGEERVGLVAHHLFWPKRGQGIFLRVDALDEAALRRAVRELGKQKAVEESEEEEGIIKELQAG